MTPRTALVWREYSTEKATDQRYLESCQLETELSEMRRERDEAVQHPWRGALEETVRILGEKLEAAEQSLAQARACIRDFAVIAKLHDKADATVTIRQGLQVWTGKHAEAIKAAQEDK